MKKIILICVIALVLILGILLYFTNGISAIYEPIKEYEYAGSIHQMTSHLRNFAATESNVDFKISDSLSINRNEYSLYFNIIINDNNINLIYELKCINSEKELLKTKIFLIGVHDKIKKTGGYNISDPGVKTLLEYFDLQFLPALENKERIKITPI